MSDLSVWCNGEDWVVASGSDDANAICTELYGEYEDDGAWRKLPDDKKVRVDDYDDQGELDLTCAQWVAKNGRGHLCSIDY